MPRPRFTLRVMLAATAVLCFWLWRQMDWIAKRHLEFDSKTVRDDSSQQRSAPGLLHLFGEKGHARLRLSSEAWADDLARARLQSLFPEALLRENNWPNLLTQPMPEIEAAKPVRSRNAATKISD